MPKREPVPEGDLHTVPEHLTAEQQQHWTRAIAALPAGLLKRSDEPLLAVFCMAHATAVDANLKLAKSPLVINVGSGKQRVLVANPFENNRRQNIALMVKIASEFGMSSVSRTRIEVRPDASTDEDEWDEILTPR